MIGGHRILKKVYSSRKWYKLISWVLAPNSLVIGHSYLLLTREECFYNVHVTLLLEDIDTYFYIDTESKLCFWSNISNITIKSYNLWKNIWFQWCTKCLATCQHMGAITMNMIVIKYNSISKKYYLYFFRKSNIMYFVYVLIYIIIFNINMLSSRN